jgi:uncharacterized membrane protein YhaH (DUF805 family)
MSWGDIFFGFRGRIDRKTYWLASILVAIAGLLFNALLAYLATGNPLAPEVWQRSDGKGVIWVPVWLAYFAFLAWPSAALAVKRLHDRDRPVWIWYLYYLASLFFALVPGESATGAGVSPIFQTLIMLLIVFTAYIFFELSVLRGTAGPNQHGEDTLPAGYYGGDYSIWSWLFALEGRISRTKWWQGFFILAAAILAASIGASVAGSAFIGRHPEFELNINNPEWINSEEGKRLLSKLLVWMLVPSLVMLVAAWSLVALGVKRLHDRGLSSWLILVVILPFFGVLASQILAEKLDLAEGIPRLALLLLAASAIWSVLQFGILKGETGPNENGPDPLAG